eukprot:6579973-Karenia_brevis.AAC.1
MPENGCGMEVKLQIIFRSDLGCTAAELQLQSTTNLRYLNCWVQKLPESVNQAIILRATCCPPDGGFQDLACVHLSHVRSCAPRVGISMA